MNIEGGISMSVPSIGPAISGPSFDPIMSGPTFSMVNEGPAPMGSFENFSPLIPSTPDLGGTIGPIEALNSTFPIAEPKSIGPLMPENFSYTPAMVETIKVLDNPDRSMYSDPGSFYVERPAPLEWFMPEVINFPKPEEQLEQVRKTIKKLATKVIEENEVDSAIKVEPSNQLQQAVKQQKMIFRIIEEKKEEGTAPKGKDRVETSQRKMVKDLHALAKRLSDASVAIFRAFVNVKPDRTGKKMVGGEDVEKQIPNEYSGVRGKALKEDVDDNVLDGTYVLGRAAIREIKKTNSPKEMQSEVVQVWNENYTVEKSRNGEGEEASQEQVDDTYMYVPGSPRLSQTLVKVAA